MENMKGWTLNPTNCMKSGLLMLLCVYQTGVVLQESKHVSKQTEALHACAGFTDVKGCKPINTPVKPFHSRHNNSKLIKSYRANVPKTRVHRLSLRSLRCVEKTPQNICPIDSNSPISIFNKAVASSSASSPALGLCGENNKRCVRLRFD